jgi:hypothetical protein
MMKKTISILLFLSFQAGFSQLQFTDSATDLGADYAYGNTTFGGGVSFVDFDNDGWDDITYATDAGTEIYFLKNNNGVFTSVTFNGISNTLKTKQVIWVDYDNDGDKDLFVTGFEGANKFYQNDGSMNFTDISSTIGLFETDLFSYGVSFADIDNDGDLDVFISNRDGVAENQRNYLYRNDSGVYVDITAAAGIPMDSQLSFCSIIFDYNKDGYQDIYVSNDKPDNINRLYKNNGDGTFDDVSVSSGAGIGINAMTTTIGDYNNDGWFDIYVTNTPQGNELLKNNGDGTFTNVASTTGTSFDSLGWGSVFLDADNDGLLDLYVSGGFEGSATFLPSAFYHQQGNGTFVIPSNIGFADDTRESYSNAIGDINNDGKPDIVVGNDTEANFLWENKTANTNNWLKVKLEGVTSNRDGIGNTIEINIGGQSQYRYTLAGEGYLSQNSFYEFFGVGIATNIDYIKVTWTATGTVETINNVSTNQAITIQEGNGVLSNPNEELQGFSIYPNPSNEGVFNFLISNNESHQVSIFDLSGRLILKKENIENSDSIDLSRYAKGIYLAKITSGNKSRVVKLLVD